MASRFPSYSQRSKDAPMDFQWTNRTSVKPAWRDDEPSTPQKRTREQTPSTPTLGTPNPTFGSNQSVPFLFHQSPLPQSHPHPWVPPPNFSPTKAFPPPPELKDVDMTEASPARTEIDTKTEDTPVKEVPKSESRPVATGGLRRIYKQRTKRSEGRLILRKRSKDANSGSEVDTDDEEDTLVPMTQSTSNHYTLNMPAPAPPQSDLPYVLLGYLQFGFNLSLIAIFLYLLVHFIVTVQRDVEHRISEYSQDIMQDIAVCATQFRNNECATRPLPALVQQCGIWQTCMNRDPTVVGRAKVNAEMIAEVINGFVEPISWKTLIFTLTSLAFLTVFINTLLSLYRSKHQPITEAPPRPPSSFPIAPATPFPQQYGYLSPAPTPSWARTYRAEQDVSPTKQRRRLEGGLSAKIK